MNAVLALNCGSSSLKFGLFDFNGEDASAIALGEAEEIGRSESNFWLLRAGEHAKQEERITLTDHSAALAHALDALRGLGAPQIQAIGHRFVHGGPRLRRHVRLTREVLEELRGAVDYAPLHLPAALAVVDAVEQRMPRIPQVACLDTAFHSTMPDVARTFALPEDVRRRGVERYGFHGLSVESILAQLQPVPVRLIVAHLGNGASITAVRNGQSIDNSMGLTPSGGVMMGTRCGDIDPGVLTYLMSHGYDSTETLEQIFDHRSGLLGISGETSDVRTLLAARKENPRADLALRLFCYSVQKTIAAMAAALGGVDAIVFTGGIGEHAVEVREQITAGVAFLGKHDVIVLPAEEELQIGRITANLTGKEVSGAAKTLEG